MKLGKARAIAEEMRSLLELGCHRIEIVGSIRRRKPEVENVELLCIPKIADDVDRLEQEIIDLMLREILVFRLNKRDSGTYSPKNKLMLHIPSGIGMDIFSTDFECWSMDLVLMTGGEKTNKMIATAALEKGWRWYVYGRGFTTPNGEIICHSECEVFELVGLPYLDPWQRE